MDRPDLRAEQKAERRERILASAREMIGSRGYESLTMRDLARAARVTVPTIYNLIGGKDAVLFAAVEEQTARFLQTIELGGRSSAASRALNLVDSCTREMLQMRKYYRSLLGILLLKRPARGMRDLVDHALIGEFEAALLEIREAGELAPWVEPATLARFLTSELEATSMRWAAGELESERLADAAGYGVGLMLLAATNGASHRELASRVVSAQRRIPSGRRPKSPVAEVVDAQA